MKITIEEYNQIRNTGALIALWEQMKLDESHKWCYDCTHYYEDCFCSYEAEMCHIHGSLDCDQKERNSCITANFCPDYEQKLGPRYRDKFIK